MPPAAKWPSLAAETCVALVLATQSNNIDIADRVIDSITARFALLARQPYIGRRRDEDLRPGVRSLMVGD